VTGVGDEPLTGEGVPPMLVAPTQFVRLDDVE
jgi:hypothetical protein